MKMKHVLVAFMVLGLAFTMPAPALSQAKSDTIRIGVFLPMTGGVAAYGQGSWQGIQVAREMKPTILLQLLFAASLTILVVRLNIKFSTPPVKEQGEDPMEKYLYDYMHRITPFFQIVDRKTAHEIAAAVLSFKFDLYPKTIGSADNAISGLKGEGAFAALRKALTIIRDRAKKLEASEVKDYSSLTFTSDEEQYLAIIIPEDQIESIEVLTLDNSLLLAYAVAYLCSPDDGQMLDEHQNFAIQILAPYKQVMGF